VCSTRSELSAAQLRLEEGDTKLVVVNARENTFVIDLATRTATDCV
jgi:hypothetical protein